jgi:hypothetical protein
MKIPQVIVYKSTKIFFVSTRKLQMLKIQSNKCLLKEISPISTMCFGFTHVVIYDVKTIHATPK